MNKGYLLDTNIISDLIRFPQGKVADKLIQVGDKSICTSIIVAAEIRFGTEKRASKLLTKQAELVLSAINIFPFQAPADRHYSVLRCYLEKNGTPIGPNDMLIAAHALTLNRILVTNNMREFSRIPNLQVENWLSHPVPE